MFVNAASAGPLEQGEGPIMGIEHHLLRLARIGAHEQHPAVAEPDVSDSRSPSRRPTGRSRGSSRTNFDDHALIRLDPQAAARIDDHGIRCCR
jgi:hypothetical protein